MHRLFRYPLKGLVVSLFVLFCFSPDASAQQAQLAWNPDASQVAGYEVYYGLSSGNYTANSDVGNTTTATLQNLSSPTYYIAVTAYDSNNNQSGFSPELVINLMTASAGAGGTIAPSGSFFQSQGASQTFTITPSGGYQIADVQVDGQSAGPVSTYTLTGITAPHTISATFAATGTNYIITATAGSNGSISPSGALTANCGASQTFTITPNTGCQVAGVTVDGTALSNPVTTYTFNNVTANHSISATFVLNTFTITSAAGANGSISPSPSATVSYGASQTFTITPDTSHRVAGVQVDGVPVGAVTTYTFSNAIANHTIAATFAPIITYTISATALGSGSISPSGKVSVVSGTNRTFTITPSANYEISGVKVDGKSIGAVSSYTFTDTAANHTIVATFALIRYSIRASFEGGGLISPSGTLILSAGAKQAFTITPAARYQLAYVLVDGEEIGAVSIGGSSGLVPSGKSTRAVSYVFTNVTGNHTIQAMFAKVPPPVADAGPDQVVTGGSIVTLNGSNSTDTGSGIAYYKWTQVSGPPVKLSKPSAPVCTFTATNTTSGKVLAFNLAVTNQAGVTGSDCCLVNVSAAGKAPSAHACADQIVTAYTNVTLDGSGSTEPDGTIASYSWVQINGPSVEILNANTAYASFVAPDVGPPGASLVFQLQVTDQFGLTMRDQSIVNVVNADPPPFANAGPDQTAAAMSSVTLDGPGSYDPVNSTDSYRWKQISGVPVTLSDPTALTPVFTAPAGSGAQSADLLFMLTVTDANDQLSSTAKCLVTVTPK